MAAILEGVSLKEVAQIAHFSASALYVASEQGIRRSITHETRRRKTET